MATALLVLLAFQLLVVLNQPAHAYLDPGSGSMMLQLMLGGVAGFVVIMRLLWKRFLIRLGIRKEEKSS